MHPGILITWACLFAAGAVGTALARRADARRVRPRTGGLVRKYFTYLTLTLGVLLTGYLPVPVFHTIFAVVALGCLIELGRACGRVDERTGRPVFLAGALSLAVGYWGLVTVRTLDATGNAWGALWLLVGTTDAWAQVIGQGLGGPCLAPACSPEKRWSGLIGGTLAALLVGGAVEFALPLGLFDRLRVTLGVSLAASVGDLFESGLKRRLGVKDLSRILGDHGGLYDRFDSLWFAAPTCAWLLGRLAVMGT